MKFARLHFGKAAQHSIAGSSQGRWREGAQCRSISHRNSTNGGKRESSERFKTSENRSKADAKRSDGDATFEIEWRAQRNLQEAQAIVARIGLKKKLRQSGFEIKRASILRMRMQEARMLLQIVLRMRTQKRR